jgi:hypothetical protein
MTVTAVPASLIAGDTWAFTLTLGDYPAGTWTATIYFENSDGAFDSAASASGTDHAFTIAAATTAGYTAGRYFWSVRVVNGGTSYTVDSGWVEVQANPAAAGKRDNRPWSRRALDAIEAFLENNATTAQQAFTIGGRSVSRWSVKELMDWRDRLRTEVATDEGTNASGSGRNIKVRFGRA